MLFIVRKTKRKKKQRSHKMFHAIKRHYSRPRHKLNDMRARHNESLATIYL